MAMAMATEAGLTGLELKRLAQLERRLADLAEVQGKACRQAWASR